MLLPGARPLAREIVEKEDASQISSSFRNFSQAGIAVSQGPPSSGSPGAALGDSPEQKRLAKIRDRVPVGKVGRDRVQPVHEHAVAGQVVAVAEDAVLIVDPAPVLDMFAELLRIRRFEMSEGVVSGSISIFLL